MMYADDWIAVFIGGLVVACSVLIFFAVKFEYEEQAIKKQVVIEVTRQFREIPVCDKPVWERVTDGCGEDE